MTAYIDIIVRLSDLSSHQTFVSILDMDETMAYTFIALAVGEKMIEISFAAALLDKVV